MRHFSRSGNWSLCPVPTLMGVMGRVGGWHFAGLVYSWGRVVLESKTRSQLADCSIDNSSFDELVLRGWFCESFLGVQFDLFPKLFQWSCKSRTPCVKSPSAYITACSWTCLKPSAVPKGWQQGLCRAGGGRRGWKSQSGPVVRSLAYQVQGVRPHSVSNG